MSNNNKKKIGLLGGSFDPPHKGHIYISKKSLKLLKLNKIIWAITEQNPLKRKPLLSLSQRKKLCLKLIKNNKKIQLKYLEDKIKSKTSIALIKYLKKFNNYNIFFIVGSDKILELHRWKNYKQILKIANLVVFSRKGFDTKAKKSAIMKKLNNKNITFFKKLRINVSSTRLRNKIINGSKRN